jgi:hypothetical protein
MNILSKKELSPFVYLTGFLQGLGLYFLYFDKCPSSIKIYEINVRAHILVFQSAAPCSVLGGY